MNNSNDVQAVKARIKEILRRNKTNENQLAEGDGGFQKQLNNQISHSGRLTVNTLLFILDRFPDVSTEWLLRGREPKEQTGYTSVGDNSIANNHNTTVNDTEAVKCLVNQLEEKDKQIVEKDHQINSLLQLLERQQVG